MLSILTSPKFCRLVRSEGEITLEPLGEEFENRVLHNFKYMINVSTRFQYRRSKSVGGIHETVNPFPNKPWILRVCSTGLLKIL